MVYSNTVGVALLVALAVVSVVSYCTNWQQRWKFRKIPGPSPSFPLGNLAQIRKKQLFRAYTDWAKQYGDTFKVFFVRQPIIVTTDPNLVRQIAIKDFNKFHDRMAPQINSRSLFSGPRLEAAQAGMLLARGSFWGSLRAGVQPMFHSTHLTTYAETINQAVDDLAVNLDKIAEAGEEVDIFRQLGRLTMQVIGAAAFGVKFDTQQAGDGEEIPLVKAAKTIFDTSDPSFWSLCALVSPLPLLPAIRLLAHMFPGKHMQTSQKAFETLYDASNALIENSRKVYNSNSEKPASWTWFPRNPDNPYKDTVPAENSVISMLMKANNKATGTPFTQLQIAAQTNTMMLAGYETTANTLAFSVYLLGKHPQAQQRLLQEVDHFQGRPTYDSLPSFPYAAAIINEALRLYPPATFLTRVTTDKVQLGPYFLPKGTGVHMNLWAMQHDERYWQDAEAFKPERWIGDKTGGDRTGGLAYLPFGVGPRMCVGIKLALEEAIIALVRLHQRYTFKLSQQLLTSPLEVKQGITMSPKHGIPVTVVQRDNSKATDTAAGM
ncbi:hypothetical protein ABBQ32_005937 [Trebouxia sp. C0010 RCD-2024]